MLVGQVGNLTFGQFGFNFQPEENNGEQGGFGFVEPGGGGVGSGVEYKSGRVVEV